MSKLKAIELTPAQQIAGFLKLTSAHYHANMGSEMAFMDARKNVASSMDCETFLLAVAIKEALGGWYTGEGL